MLGAVDCCFLIPAFNPDLKDPYWQNRNKAWLSYSFLWIRVAGIPGVPDFFGKRIQSFDRKICYNFCLFSLLCNSGWIPSEIHSRKSVQYEWYYKRYYRYCCRIDVLCSGIQDDGEEREIEAKGFLTIGLITGIFSSVTRWDSSFRQPSLCSGWPHY